MTTESENAWTPTLGVGGSSRRASDRRWLILVAGTALASCVLATAISSTRLATTGSGPLAPAANVALALACGLFLTSGVLWLCRWRILRESRSALMGSAVLLLGVVSLPIGGLQQVIEDPHAGLFGTVGRGVSSVVCIGLVLRAITVADRRQRPPLERLLPGLAVLVAIFLFALAALSAVVGGVSGGSAAQHAMVASLLALGWIGVGLVGLLRGPLTPWTSRAMPLVFALGVSELLRIVDHGGVDGWTLGALLLCVAVALFAAHLAVTELDEAVAADQARLADVSSALGRVQTAVERHLGVHEEVTHDARNAFAGLRAALRTLEKYDGRLDEEMAAGLRRAVMEEVAHLEDLFIRSVDHESQTFDLADLVSLVVQTRRALGADIRLHAAPAIGCGRPHDVMTALHNLLTNAQVHATGSPVTVTVRAEATRAVVTVADEGPGLSAADARRIFQRGERGSSSTGSGLGLHVARSLLRAQGGDLELVRREGGATFRLSVPTRRATGPRAGTDLGSRRAGSHERPSGEGATAATVESRR